jgi:hypothetical protein
MSLDRNWLSLPAPCRSAFMAGRHIGTRDIWIARARLCPPSDAMRIQYVRWAREANHYAVRELRVARERLHATR